MNDVSVIDRFLNTFSAYIDSGFGLLHGEVAFLTATLVVIDMTLAGLYRLPRLLAHRTLGWGRPVKTSQIAISIGIEHSRTEQ